MTREVKNSGSTASVRRYIEERAGATLLISDIEQAFAPNFPAGVVRSSISYLSAKTKEVERIGSLHVKWLMRAEQKKTYLPTVVLPKAAEGAYIGVLFDDTDVIIQVGTESIRMKPDDFKTLRMRLRSLD